MKINLHWIVVLCWMPLMVFGQKLQYGHSGIPVVGKSGNALSNPFAGGINSGQFGQIDLNGDGQLDMVVFDRTSDKISTFLKKGGQFEYAPQYEPLFPQPLFNWVLMADYDGDGRIDLFTSTNLGIKAYRNVTVPGQELAWQLIADPILTQGISLINLFVNSTDLPAIRDVDGDGDLDIMVFNFASGGFVEFHKNMSMERFGNRNVLVYERVSREWGDFRECFCGEFAYGGAPCTTFGRLEHVAGKALTVVDVTGDGKLDLLFGEELCPDLFLLENTGGIPNAVFRNGRAAFAALDGAMYFPAAYEVDVDGDGVNELIVSPNDRRNELDLQDFSQSVHLLKKNSSGYDLVEPAFLQSTMIDVGEGSAPLLADVDGDGLTDLLIGNRGAKHAAKFVASIAYYRNIGTAFQPAFSFQTHDFLSISSLNLLHIRPKMLDFNRDGRPDLVFSGFDGQRTNLYVIAATSSGFSLNNLLQIPMPINELDNLDLYDINKDGLLDMIVGTSSGRLDVYYNVGSAQAPQFQLHTSGLLGITTNPSRTNLSILVADVDQSGTDDLLLYDDSGELRVIYDFQNPTDGPQAIVIEENGQDVRLGRLGTMTTGKLFDDGRTSLMFGNAQGGVFHFTYAADPSTTDEWEVYLFPNPSSTGTIRVVSNKPAIATVYAISGQLIVPAIAVPSRRPQQVTTSHLAQGIYIMRLMTQDGELKSLKFIVDE